MATKTLTPQSVADPKPPIKVKVELSEPLLAQYEALAAAQSMDVETYLTEHLRQTVKHDHTGASLYFSSSEVKELCKLSGRGICNDPMKIVQRLKPLASVKVGTVELPVDAQLLDRVSHNHRVRKGLMTADEFIAKEGINGIRTSVGLNPR